MVLDTQTTIFMICFVYLMLHAGIWLALLEYRNLQVKLWCGSGLISGLGVVLLALRGGVSEFMFLYVAQLLMLVGNWGRMIALRIYLKPDPHPSAYRIYAFANIAYFLIFITLADILNNEWAALIWFNGFYALLCFDYFQIGKLLNRRHRSLGARLLMSAGLAFTVSLGLRALGVALDGEAPTVYEASWHQAQMIIGQFTAITLSNIAFLRIFLEIAERKKIAMTHQLASTTERAEVMRQTSLELKQLLDEREEIIRQLAIFNKTAGMGALVASLAHELNQPLTAIQLNAELIQSTLNDKHQMLHDTEAARVAMRDLMKDNQRAANIIITLRNMFGSGKKSISEFDVNQLIGDVLLLCKPKLNKNCIALDVRLHHAELNIVGDSAQLQQVFLNLLTNAIDALRNLSNQSGLIQVISRTSHSSAVIEVRDNGPGISAEIAPHVFDLLRTNKDDGMGVGLWLSKTIVESHGGSITFTSEQLGSTVFTVELPLSESEMVF